MMKFLSGLLHKRLYSAFNAWKCNTIGFGGYKLKRKYKLAVMGAKVL